MTSRLSVHGIVQEFKPEFGWLRAELDSWVRDSSLMFEPRGIAPRYIMSILSRNGLGGRTGRSSPVREGQTKPLMRVERSGQDYIKVHVVGLSPLKLRMRPAGAHRVQTLVDTDEAIPALFEAPRRALVLFWDWDASIGMVRSLSLAQVSSLKDLDKRKCPILDEAEIELTAGTRSQPVGAGRDEDDLGDILHRLTEGGGTDEPDGFASTDIDENRNHDDDEGNTALGAAG